MPTGWVTTARGEQLNMDELKNKANLPLVKEKQTKTQVKKHHFSKRKPLNIRGYQPVQGEHVIDQEPPKTVPDDSLPKSSYAEDGKAKTVAEVTGVKVKMTDGAVQRAKERAGVAEDQEAANAEAASKEALGEILEELGNSNPNAEEAAKAEEKKTTRRSRKKSD